MRAKKAKVLYIARCLVCSEADGACLDAHRAIVPGIQGGGYCWSNILVTCANCHRKTHDGKIEVLGRHLTSSGRWVWRLRENGTERFATDGPEHSTEKENHEH